MKSTREPQIWDAGKNNGGGTKATQMKDVLALAKKQLAEVTGLKVEAATGAFKDDQGWHVRLDMLEMTRVPSSTDILGDYEVLLTEDGLMLSFQLKGTRLRSESVAEKIAG